MSSTLLTRHELDERHAHNVCWINYGKKYYFRKMFVAEKVKTTITRTNDRVTWVIVISAVHFFYNLTNSWRVLICVLTDGWIIINHKQERKLKDAVANTTHH